MEDEIHFNRLKSARKIAMMTQQQLADKLGMTKQAVSKYEKGNIKINYKYLYKLCECTGVKMDFFYRKDYEIVISHVTFNKSKV